MLKIKAACEKCATALAADGLAFICSFECTYCADCSAALTHCCPNCQGELLRRPARRRSVGSVAVSQLRSRLRRLLG